jgi:alkaline phosphatase D
MRTEGITNVVSCAGDHHAHFAGRLVPDTSNPKDKPVALEFACAGISSEPMFLGAERATRSSSIFHAIATFESGGKKYENFNQAFLGGTYAALMRALTGSSWMAYAYWNPSINPGLDFVDSNANGYGLVNLGTNLGETILVTTADAETDHGTTGAPVLRTTAFRFEPWKAGQEPLLTAPVFTGEPPFPFPL